jgi:hypothetical protein
VCHNRTVSRCIALSMTLRVSMFFSYRRAYGGVLYSSCQQQIYRVVGTLKKAWSLKHRFELGMDWKIGVHRQIFGPHRV